MEEEEEEEEAEEHWDEVKRRSIGWNGAGASRNVLNNSIPSMPISNQQNQQNQCDKREGVCQVDRIEEARLENEILAQLASQRAVVIRPADVRIHSHSPTVCTSLMHGNDGGDEERERKEEEREHTVNRRQRSNSPIRRNYVQSQSHHGRNAEE